VRLEIESNHASSLGSGLDNACGLLNHRLKLLQLGLNCLDSPFESRQGYHSSFHERPKWQAFDQLIQLLGGFHFQDDRQLDGPAYRSSCEQLPLDLPLPANLEAGQDVSFDQKDAVLGNFWSRCVR
jgi:hypothetical protein